MLSCHTANSITKKVTAPLAHSSAKLGWILLSKKLISSAELESVLNQQERSHQKLGELLVEAKLISEQQLTQLLQEQYWRRNGYWVI
jgi:hypothetical protein